ncbi:MAG: HAMP domain-containing histidine kinase [Lachnospiraceae bacterium]|nr:HAMP domain-containing histidine kinase [Lachnospiraceae bacterium]
MELRIQGIIIGIAIALCILVRVPWIMCIILGCAIVAVYLISVIAYRQKEKRIEELIYYLMKVQDNLELPALSNMEEGNLGILHSEIYKLVTQLKERYDGENKQKRYMVDMLSDISHQIKTPLTAITMMTELLKAPELSDEKRLDYVAKIDQQTKRITWFVRNLLTLSQLEADMLELKKEKESLKSILDSIMETFEIMAEVKDIQLTCDVPEEIMITCDRQWTTEAISNIVKNCIEHTPEGGSVSVQAIQHNIATEITITDTGEGISKEHLPYIFKRFYKAPGSSNSSVGIGLSMSKQIIMRQNGNITVESEVGTGSKFVIKLY